MTRRIFPDAGSSWMTLPSVKVATQTEPFATTIESALRATRTLRITLDPWRSYSVTVPFLVQETHTPPSPTATPEASSVGIRTVTLFDVASMRDTIPPVPSTTQTAPSPPAMVDGLELLSAARVASTFLVTG